MFDLALHHTWGGALIEPLTDLGRDWCEDELGDDNAAVHEPGCYLVDHRDGVDVAEAAKRAGLTFANMEVLA